MFTCDSSAYGERGALFHSGQECTCGICGMQWSLRNPVGYGSHFEKIKILSGGPPSPVTPGLWTPPTPIARNPRTHGTRAARRWPCARTARDTVNPAGPGVRACRGGQGCREPSGYATWFNSPGIPRESLTQRVKMGRGDKCPFSRGRDPP